MVLAMILFASCEESRKRAEERLNQLNEQAEELNNTVENGIDQIESLDSVINTKVQQINEIDSLVENAATQIDSVVTENIETYKNIAN